MEKRFLTFSVLFMCSYAFLFSARLESLATLAPQYSNAETSITGFVNEPIALSHFKRSAQQEPLICLGFHLSSVNLDVVAAFNLHQKLSILPDSQGFLWFQNQASLALDNNAPHLGYAEFRYKGFLGSVGRRPLKWGPGVYDLGLSSEVPFYDALWLQYRYDQPYGAWWYQMMAADVGSLYRSDAFPLSKQLYAHRVGFENQKVRATLSELAMRWGSNSMLGLLPFGIWPAGLQESSNMLIEATAEALLGQVRLYGSMIVNDRTLFGLEQRIPLALGGMLGLDWHLFSGSSSVHKKSFALAENTFRTLQGGLSIGAECYYTSNYLYTSTDHEGTFTALLKQFAYGGALYGDSLAYYFGFPYGPGSLLAQTMISYEDHGLQIRALLGILAKNSATASTLQGSMNLDEFSLSDASYHLLATLEAEYQISKALQLTATLKRDWNIHTNASELLFGVGARLCWIPSRS